jgi:hypothetical protein
MGRLFQVSRLGPEFDRAGEHAIHHSQEGVERVFKVTHPGQAGLVLRAVAATDGHNVTHSVAVPQEYLERMILTNEVWGDELVFEGLIEGDLPSLVISQPRLEGPHPEPIRINAFLRQQGFVRKDTLMWYRPADGLAVSDTKPSNFIETPAGDILPIDLPMRFASLPMTQAWGEPPPPYSALQRELHELLKQMEEVVTQNP